jgi:hypothetical protein
VISSTLSVSPDLSLSPPILLFMCVSPLLHNFNFFLMLRLSFKFNEVNYVFSFDRARIHYLIFLFINNIMLQ